MVKANFVQLVRMVLETPSLLKLSKCNLEDYVVFSGGENLKAALARGKGVLFLTAHLGNWELMALAVSLKYDMPSNILVRPLDSRPLDRVMTEIRSRTGNRVLDKDKSAGVVSQLLSENQVIGILLDQNASWFEGVYVPFFNQVACTNKGAGHVRHPLRCHGFARLQYAPGRRALSGCIRLPGRTGPQWQCQRGHCCQHRFIQPEY